MRKTAAIMALLLALATEGSAAIRPRVIDTHFPTDDVVIASIVIEAPRDGVGDATGAIQAAIDQAAAAGGGVVFLPAGRYRLAGRLVLKEGVTLRGDWGAPKLGKPLPAKGTLLMPTADKGNPDAPPAITMERGTGLTNLAIWYPDQDPMKIVPYPWTIRTSEKVTGNNITIQYVTLVNPYQAIKIGPEWNELHTIRNVFGTPLKAGIWIDTCTDIGRLIDVDFGPDWWGDSGLPGAPATLEDRKALHRFVRREGVAFEVRRSDWQYLHGIGAFDYAVGLKFTQGQRGAANAVMFDCELLHCRTALELDSLNPIGLAATGCLFHGTEQTVATSRSFNSFAQFARCRIDGQPKRNVLLDGPGTVALRGCYLGWLTPVTVEARQGNLLYLDSSSWGEARVLLGSGVRRAWLFSYPFAGKDAEVQNASRGDVRVGGGGFFRDLDSVPFHLHSDSPGRKPASRQLFVVTDFGAAPSQKDNTPAFAKALQAARKAGGGTVYVPAGNYRFAGEIVVPGGVELRGIFDVPHHTVSGGSVLMPTAGKGKADGTPFIRLEPMSGLRGLTFWYPEQNLRQIVAYPWAIQSLGPGCWLVDVTLGNAYQGADFWTHPSDGHVISYLAGAVFKRGLFVSKCKGEGWVEDVQFNPHYSVRVHPSLKSAHTEGKDIQAVIAYQRANLEGLVFGRCQESITRTFLYAAYDGIAFRDDGGGANARVIIHGTDTGSRGAVLEGSANVTFINAQLVPLGAHEQGAIIVADSFKGKASFFNTQIWGGRTSGIIGGQGDVLIQGVNTLCGPFILKGGRVAIENAHWTRDLPVHIRVEPGVESARLIANLAPGELRIENKAGGRLYARANSLAIHPSVQRFQFRTGFEAGQPQGLANTVARRGGGIKSVSKHACRPAETNAHTGKRALRVAGHADDPAYSYVYFKLFDGPLGVAPDSVLSYWTRPSNERGRCVGIDLLFADGSNLRDSQARTTGGQGVHPGNPKGVVGQWTRIAIPIGRTHAGKVISAIVLAYDSRTGGGPFEAWVDDVALESARGALPQRALAKPAGGVYRGKVTIELSSPDGAAIRYSFDGISPTAASRLYKSPIVLDKRGLWELRFAAQAPDGSLGRVFSELYEVTE